MGTSEQDQAREGQGTDDLCQVHLMRIAEMPCIELYLDQVLKLVCDGLSFMALPGEVPLTGSMVNNYVKQHVVPAPVKKRYTRRCLAYLLFVCAFKRAFSIAEVAKMIQMMEEAAADEATLYDAICTALEAALAARFGGEQDVAAAQEALAQAAGTPELALVLAAAVDTLASKIYVEKCLERGER